MRKKKKKKKKNSESDSSKLVFLTYQLFFFLLTFSIGFQHLMTLISRHDYITYRLPSQTNTEYLNIGVRGLGRVATFFSI